MTARQKENRRRTLLRSAVQLFFFLLMPGAFTAGFAGVKYIFTQVGSGSVIEMNGFLKVLLMLLLFTVFFGRFFCGYLCAFGSLGDALYALFGFIRKKLFKKKKPSAFPPKLMRILQKLKYVNLAVIALFCVLGLFGKLAGWSVWDVFSRLTALKGVDARYLPGELQEGRFFGILEPDEHAPRLEPEKGGLIIVPALAYDRGGYRMGQGGGYYDRYLSARDLFSVGIGRDCLLCDSVLREEHDTPVDCLVTETGVYRFPRA